MFTMIVPGEFFSAFLTTGIDADDLVAAALAEDGVGLEAGDKARTKHSNIGHGKMYLM